MCKELTAYKATRSNLPKIAAVVQWAVSKRLFSNWRDRTSNIVQSHASKSECVPFALSPNFHGPYSYYSTTPAAARCESASRVPRDVFTGANCPRTSRFPFPSQPPPASLPYPSLQTLSSFTLNCASAAASHPHPSILAVLHPNDTLLYPPHSLPSTYHLFPSAHRLPSTPLNSTPWVFLGPLFPIASETSRARPTPATTESRPPGESNSPQQPQERTEPPCDNVAYPMRSS